MPNFDSFERLVRRAMVASEDEIRLSLADFGGIAPANRPRLFKRMSGCDFSDWLLCAHRFLRATYGEGAEFSTTDQNATGADLLVRESGVQIELKTGAVTDANLGVGTIAWAMGDKAGNKKLRDIMDGPEMMRRREFASEGKLGEIQTSQEFTMRALEVYFRSRLAQGSEAPAILTHLVRCVARCITKQKDMRALLGKDESGWNAPDILHAHRETGWEKVTHPFQANEHIVVSSIFRPSHSLESETIGRAQVILEGQASKQKALIYPNYKNSHKNTDGTKINASHWVATPCFHVWIRQA